MYIDPFWLGVIVGSIATFAFLTFIGKIMLKNKEEKHG